jgi:antitoxin Phd
MQIETKNMLSISEANQNFSKVTRLVDKNGSAVILKNNIPQYVVLPFKTLEDAQLMPDEDLFTISNRLMEQNRKVYEILAK